MGAARVDAFVPAQLVQRRVAAGLSQAELARRVGTRKQSVWRWEHGFNGRCPSPAMLAKLASALGIEPAALTAAGAPTLAGLRQLAGLTQAELADLLGMSEDRWSGIERGLQPVPATHLGRAAELLGRSPAQVEAARKEAARAAAAALEQTPA